MDTKTIYVQLLNEGTTTYRPTVGCEITKCNYKLLKSDDYDSESEDWEFEPGSIVRCELKQLSVGQVLVAVELSEKKP